MSPAATAPVDDLVRARESEVRLFARVRAFDDDAMHRPSLLPGWTVGHLLTHLARNADSHTRRALASAAGEIVDQYPGGADERAADIDGGAGRRAAAVLADVAGSSARMLETWASVPDHAWAGVTRDLSGRERPLAELPGRRWLEVEVHLVDLGTGPTHRDWSDDFVAARLGPMRATVADRLPAGADPPPAGALDERDELAWLYGRLARADLPVLGPWS
jgi:maleylpyruvate isomerase